MYVKPTMDSIPESMRGQMEEVMKFYMSMGLPEDVAFEFAYHILFVDPCIEDSADMDESSVSQC
jgi:hypothetical protein